MMIAHLKNNKHVHSTWCTYLGKNAFAKQLLFVLSRPYGGSAAAAEAPVHENPEWEKARQALASISKSQCSTKTAPANHTSTQVSFHSQKHGYHLLCTGWGSCRNDHVIRDRIIPQNNQEIVLPLLHSRSEFSILWTWHGKNAHRWQAVVLHQLLCNFFLHTCSLMHSYFC